MVGDHGTASFRIVIGLPVLAKELLIANVGPLRPDEDTSRSEQDGASADLVLEPNNCMAQATDRLARFMPDRGNDIPDSTDKALKEYEADLEQAEMTGEEQPRSVHPGGVEPAEGRVPGVSRLVDVDDLL